MHTSNEKAIVVRKPAGRPRLEVNEVLPPNWKMRVLQEMAAGASLIEVKALLWFLIKENLEGILPDKADVPDQLIRISNDLYYRWYDENKEFSETIKFGKFLAEAWWKLKGRQSVDNKNFNHALWFMNMRNRFGWTNDPKGEEQSEEELNSINELFERLNKATPRKDKS
jgi:hypothetical protein